MTAMDVRLRRAATGALLAAAALTAAGCSTVDKMRHGGGHQAAETHLVIPERCGDLSFPVYFEDKRAELTRPARQLITEAAQNNRDCHVARVDVIGLADYRGTPDRDLDISRRRAMAVAKALSRAGFPVPSFGVVAAGAAGAVSEDGMPEMMRRRADVSIHYTPRA